MTVGDLRNLIAYPTFRFPQASESPYGHLEVFEPPHGDVQIVGPHLGTKKLVIRALNRLVQYIQ